VWLSPFFGIVMHKKKKIYSSSFKNVGLFSWAHVQKNKRRRVASLFKSAAEKALLSILFTIYALYASTCECLNQKNINENDCC
jgi:hypothetical protein